MPEPGRGSPSQLLQKVQHLAEKHGGISKIPKAEQLRLGFEVAARRGRVSISIPLPAEGGFVKSKLPPEGPRGSAPSPKGAKPTMEELWINMGWYRKRGNGIVLTRPKWRGDEGVRKEAVEFLMHEVLGKEPRDITVKDFKSNRLGGLLHNYYGDSPYIALLESGYAYSKEEYLHHAETGEFRDEKVYPWEMKTTLRGFYASGENRVAATKWLAWKLEKSQGPASNRDFGLHRLRGLLGQHTGHTPRTAFIEAGLPGG